MYSKIVLPIFGKTILLMRIEFQDDYLEQLYLDIAKGKPKFQEIVIKKYRKTIDLLVTIGSSQKFHDFKGLNFEALTRNRKGSYSVRIDYHYRLIFRLENDILELEEIILIDELSNHYQ